MATERNVVDFKIHNLTEEQFQELKAQGKIDPNAVYCTPDDTKIKFAELEEALATTNETVATNDSNAVHKIGNETIDGKKTFKQNLGFSFDGLDLSTVQESGSWHTWCQVFDKNGVRASYIETAHKADGTVQQQMGVQKTIDGTKYGAYLRMHIDANKKQHYELGTSPESGSNGTDIATTKWANDKFLPLSGGQISGVIKVNTTVVLQHIKDNSYIEVRGGTNYLNGAFLRLDGKDSSDKPGQFTLATGDGSANKRLIGKPDGSLTWNGNNIATSAWAMGVPNYASKTQISSGTTMSAHGWVFGGRYHDSSMSARIKVNDNVVYYSSTSHAGNAYGIVPVAKGDVVTLGSGTYYFVPCKNS